MSIIAYTGLPGSGKSYGVVEHQILPALRAGRTVCTNIPLHEAEVRKVVEAGELVEFPLEAVKAEPDRIFDFARPGWVVVIDEVWQLWPAGVQTAKVPEAYKSLLAEHRHMVDAAGNSMQIVLVTQDLAQISTFARALVEQTYRVSKLSALGASRRFRVDIYSGGVTGQRPPEGRRVRQVYGTYKPEIYRLYKSHTMSESAADGANESVLDKRGVLWKRWEFMFGGPLVLALVAWGVGYAYTFFTPELPPRGEAPAAKVPGGMRVSGGVGVVERRGRVSGYLEPLSVVIERGDGESITVPWHAARCVHRAIGGVQCEWDGRTYVSAFGRRREPQSDGERGVGSFFPFQ